MTQRTAGGSAPAAPAAPLRRTSRRRLPLSDGAPAAAGLGTFLGRLLRWEKTAAVRLRADGGTLAVFARPARFEVLAVWTAPVALCDDVDATVSAGELLEGIEESTGELEVPAQVTGPSWAGVLPPRGGWRPLEALGAEDVRRAAASVVAEFRTRSEALTPGERTRGALDALAAEIWSRTLPGTPLPLRAVHAAHALGFLRVPDGSADALGLSQAGPWLRLSTPAGSVLARTASTTPRGRGLSVTPV